MNVHDRPGFSARTRAALWCCALFVVVWSVVTSTQSGGAATITVFEGARLIRGDGGVPIESSAFIVQGDRITTVGRKGQVRVPAGATRIDLTGKTVIPALIDAHTHPGYRKGLSFSAANYTRDNLVDTLNRLAYFGVGATLALGTDAGELPYQLRAQPVPGAALFRLAGSGFAMPDAGPGIPLRDAAYHVTTEEQARRDVRALADRRVDIVKMWVDDRDGTEQKLPPAVYRAIIDEAHKRNLRVVAHIRELEDAKNVLRAGADGFAHPPRDLPVDDEFLGIVKRHPGVFFVTTLWGERLGGSTGVPEWINEPIAGETFSAEELKTLADPFRTATPAQIAQSRKYVETTRVNVARLAAAGARFGLGTDAGGNTGGQFFGLSAHIEMEMMVAAGLTPDQVIVAATRNSARILGLEDHGTIASGQSADFIVLDADPREDIRNTRKIARVYLRGREIDRPALRAKWSAE